MFGFAEDQVDKLLAFVRRRMARQVGAAVAAGAAHTDTEHRREARSLVHFARAADLLVVHIVPVRAAHCVRLTQHASLRHKGHTYKDGCRCC